EATGCDAGLDEAVKVFCQVYVAGWHDDGPPPSYTTRTGNFCQQETDRKLYPSRSFLIRLNKMRAACASAGAFTSRFAAIAEATAIRSSRCVRYRSASGECGRQRVKSYTRGASTIRCRDVVGAVHGLVDYLRIQRKRVPGEVLVGVERLECLLFLGYEPHFD